MNRKPTDRPLWLMAVIVFAGVASFSALSIRARTAPQSDVEENKLAIALNALIDAASDGFKELIAGSGRESDGSVTYPCSMPLPGASETLIRVSKDMRPYVSAKFYGGKDKIKGKKIYGDLLTKLKRILADWPGKEQETQNDRYVDSSYRSQLESESTSVTLRYVSYKDSDTCTVSLTVWSPYSLTPDPTTKTEVSTEWKGGSREEVVRAILKQFVARDFNGIRARFNQQLKTNLSVQQLEVSWNSLTQQLGEFKSQEQPQTRRSRGYDVVAIISRMERGAIELEVYFDTNGELGGLWIHLANPF